MIAAVLCALAFIVTYIFARRSLVDGVICTLAVGYAFGIIRGNLQSTASYFLFDVSVAALYLAQLFAPVRRDEVPSIQAAGKWMMALVAWPALMLFVPIQDPLIQLVGFRANAYFVPMIYLGARMRDMDWDKLAWALGWLNLIAFAFAVAEFFLGVERFFPDGPVNDLIYKSIVEETRTFRIPACFPNSSTYGFMMLVTLPLLVGAWDQRRQSGSALFYVIANIATILGILMCASRTAAGLLGVFIIGVVFSLRVSAWTRALWLFVLVGVGLVVFREERLQRFTDLSDVEMVQDRILSSVNMRFLDVLATYPLGNGLGGGGSSIPSFLASRIGRVIVIENEYARILLEQGIVGLILWLSFLFWLLVPNRAQAGERWSVGRTLARLTIASVFASAVIGTGLLASIPTTTPFLLLVGWLARKPQARHRATCGRANISVVAGHDRPKHSDANSYT